MLKVIVGGPAMIKAYKAGVPANGQSFPEGSGIVKIQWKSPTRSDEQRSEWRRRDVVLVHTLR